MLVLLTLLQKLLQQLKLKTNDAMKEANKVAGKQDNYANLSEQINKILEDTNDHIFERDLQQMTLTWQTEVE